MKYWKGPLGTLGSSPYPQVIPCQIGDVPGNSLLPLDKLRFVGIPNPDSPKKKLKRPCFSVGPLWSSLGTKKPVNLYEMAPQLFSFFLNIWAETLLLRGETLLFGAETVLFGVPHSVSIHSYICWSWKCAVSLLYCFISFGGCQRMWFGCCVVASWWVGDSNVTNQEWSFDLFFLFHNFIFNLKKNYGHFSLRILNSFWTYFWNFDCF